MQLMKKLSLVLISAFALSSEAFALPSVGTNQRFIPESTGKVDFEGVLEIRDGSGGCSASLIRYESSRATDLALVLTNGHCVESGMPKAGEFILNKPSARRFNIVDPRDGQDIIGSLKATKLIYATMTKTDISIYSLDMAYQDIESKFGIRPFTLASKRPAVGLSIEIASGYWRRGYVCAIEAIIPMIKEAGWSWKTSIRYSRPGCETIGGTSGSPIVASGTRDVIGINNTGNESGQLCTMNNPCEVDSAGKPSAHKGYSYGQQTFWIYSCLDRDLNFDLRNPNCELPGGARAGFRAARVR